MACTYNVLVRGETEPGLPRAFLRGPNLVPRGQDIPCVLCSHRHLFFGAVSRLVSASTNLLASSSIPGQGRQPAPILLGPCHSVPFAGRWLGAVSSEASLCYPIDPTSSTVALSLPLPKDRVLHHACPGLRWYLLGHRSSDDLRLSFSSHLRGPASQDLHRCCLQPDIVSHAPAAPVVGDGGGQP